MPEIIKKKAMNRKKIVKALDAIFSMYIRKRDNYRCFTCGQLGGPKDGIMQAGHLFSRVNYSTRWDELNTHCQCKSCNYTHEFNPHIYVNKFIDKYGLEKYQDLTFKHNQQFKISTPDLLVLTDYYKKKRKEFSDD